MVGKSLTLPSGVKLWPYSFSRSSEPKFSRIFESLEPLVVLLRSGLVRVRSFCQVLVSWVLVASLHYSQVTLRLRSMVLTRMLRPGCSLL